MNTVDLDGSERDRLALERVMYFGRRFGQQHLILASHAAFPLVLTPDLLYQIWATFVPQAPWVAVAQVLLSSLCREVGYEMYEMELATRTLLLRELKADDRFGERRLRELGEFLLYYVGERLTGSDRQTGNLRQVQEWSALGTLDPQQLAREIAAKMRDYYQQGDRAELLQLTAITADFEESLVDAGCDYLLIYAKGMSSHLRGETERARREFETVSTAELEEKNLLVPSEYRDREFATTINLMEKLELPEGAVPLSSPFYIERDHIEEFCYKIIVQPGSLLRIKAPQEMGKTSLMLRILDRCKKKGYRTVYLRLRAIDRRILDNLDSFLQWLCQEVGRKLLLEDKLSEYWDGVLLSSISNCNDYFERHLLPSSHLPLVLGLDDVDRVFEGETAQNFFGMLKTWHEYGKDKTLWKKLHMVIAYSTDVYTLLNISRSPFNVGEAVELPDFNSKQVQHLVQLHKLNWDDSQVNLLMEMVGGHPYLIRQALYQAVSRQLSFNDILSKAPIMSGIYQDHLLGQLVNLRVNLDLTTAFEKVVLSKDPIQLPRIETFKLLEMGLVKLEGNLVKPRYELYRLFFSQIYSGKSIRINKFFKKNTSGFHVFVDENESWERDNPHKPLQIQKRTFFDRLLKMLGIDRD